MDQQTIDWLRGLAEKGSRGVVNNIDARSLGRIADKIEQLMAERDRTARNRDMWKGQCERQAEQLTEAGKAAIILRNELDRTRTERDSWESQFHSAAEAASEYSEFWEKHHGDFDQFGNYVPHSQMDGDLRAAKQRIAELEAKQAITH